MTNYQTPTQEAYLGLQRAFDHFNEKLFDKRLPPVMFTLTRKRGANGYFWSDQFKHRDSSTVHEIALNPMTMDRSITAVLSTLVHEMTHLEQEEYGTPGKKGFHNREWGGLMRRVGLIPSNTGEPGGKETGRQMTHYIEEGGRFEVALAELMPFDIPYFTSPVEASEKKKDKSKVKTCCPTCNATAWCKEGMRIICAECDEEMEQEL